MPGLAERLGVPFIDRGIALAVAERLDIPVDDALADEEPSSKSLMERLLSGFLGANPGGRRRCLSETITPEDFHQAAQEALLAQAATGRGVILGRGAVAGLRNDPACCGCGSPGPSSAGSSMRWPYATSTATPLLGRCARSTARTPTTCANSMTWTSWTRGSTTW